MFRSKLHKKYWPIITEEDREYFLFEERFEILKFLSGLKGELISYLVRNYDINAQKKLADINSLIYNINNDSVSIEELNYILSLTNTQKRKLVYSILKILIILSILSFVL